MFPICREVWKKWNGKHDKHAFWAAIPCVKGAIFFPLSFKSLSNITSANSSRLDAKQQNNEKEMDIVLQNSYKC